jgi:hypothetical protein
MDQFVFDSKKRWVLGGGIILGLLCMLLTYLGDDQFHTRFWTNFLHNSVFFTGIAFISLFIIAAFTTAFAGWSTLVKRVWEAYSLFLIPGLLLMLVIVAGVWGHWHHLYHWADEEAVKTDSIMFSKSGFLNKYWYTFGTIIIVGAWIFFATKIRSLSTQEDKNGPGEDFSYHRKIRTFSVIFLPIAGFSSAAMIWQWIMSIDAHWYSTLFAWYTAASWFLSALSLSILTIIYLKSQGYMTNVTSHHLHDLGKYLFGISVFWMYLWFSQYMLIWYANVGEETIYYRERLDNYKPLFFLNIIINFLAPFFVLMRNDTKRKVGTMAFVSIAVFFGHWLDFFLMIKPGARITAMEAAAHAEGAAHEAGAHATEFAMGFSLPGLLEFGTMIGFLSLFLYIVLTRLSQASLTPKNDPYLEESLHHEVV